MFHLHPTMVLQWSYNTHTTDRSQTGYSQHTRHKTPHPPHCNGIMNYQNIITASTAQRNNHNHTTTVETKENEWGHTQLFQFQSPRLQGAYGRKRTGSYTTLVFCLWPMPMAYGCTKVVYDPVRFLLYAPWGLKQVCISVSPHSFFSAVLVWVWLLPMGFRVYGCRFPHHHFRLVCCVRYARYANVRPWPAQLWNLCGY